MVGKKLSCFYVPLQQWQEIVQSGKKRGGGCGFLAPHHHSTWIPHILRLMRSQALDESIAWLSFSVSAQAYCGTSPKITAPFLFLNRNPHYHENFHWWEFGTAPFRLKICSHGKKVAVDKEMFRKYFQQSASLANVWTCKSAFPP